VWKGAVIADSETVDVVDGYTYFPTDAINHEFLLRCDHRSVCGWKGKASYYDIVVDGEVNRAAAWEYSDPSERAAPLVGGRVGFWRGVAIELHATDGSGLLERPEHECR
jgi:uncharacterized protein (DUF427 family)